MAELLPEDRVFATHVRKALLRVAQEQNLPLTEDDLGEMKHRILEVLDARRKRLAEAPVEAPPEG